MLNNCVIIPCVLIITGIRRLSMVRHATRQYIADSWPDDGICPNIKNRLSVLTKHSRFCETFASTTKATYEVRDGRSFLPVSLTERTCKCGQWQISGIPCKHAIRAIISANKDPADYVAHWFTVPTYKEAYGIPILPIPDQQQWPTLECPALEPPTLKRSIGRPPRNRRREEGEQRKGKRSVTVKCKKCGNFGHNSKTCKGGITARERRQLERSQADSSQAESQDTGTQPGRRGKKRKANK